jgi:hypothetical protein
VTTAVDGAPLGAARHCVRATCVRAACVPAVGVPPVGVPPVGVPAVGVPPGGVPAIWGALPRRVAPVELGQLRTRALACVVTAFLGGACGAVGASPDDGAASRPCDPWAVAVVAFEPGEGAGYGADDLPAVVLGPPDGGKTTQGALDVVSLGLGGSITVELGCPATDGPGPDLFIYENAFVVGGGPRVFADPAEVAVSADGIAWATFPCTPPSTPVAEDDGVDGCAGFGPVAANADNGWTGTPAGGGDAYDLAGWTAALRNPGGAGGSPGVTDSGATGSDATGDDGADVAPAADDAGAAVRFVRITDRSAGGAAPNAGFDLDAVAGAVR